MSWRPAIVPSLLMTSAVANKAVIDKAFGAENDCYGRLRGSRRNIGPRTFEERRVCRWHRLPKPSVTRNKAFRKTNQPCRFGGDLGDGLLGQGHRLIWGCGK